MTRRSEARAGARSILSEPMPPTPPDASPELDPGETRADSELDTGLRHRLRRVVRQITEQHGHLKPLFAQLLRAIHRGDRAEARAQLDRYQKALRAHFALEDETFFPALHGLHPEWTEELTQLEREHAGLSRDLESLASSLSGSSGAPGAEALLERFTAHLRDHELREERLVSRLSEPGASTSGVRSSSSA